MDDDDADTLSSLKLLVFVSVLLVTEMLSALKDQIFHAFTLDIRS